MESVNLKDARKGDFQNVKRKTACWILADVARHHQSPYQPGVETPYETWVCFYTRGIDKKTNFYRVTDSAVAARLVSKELRGLDLVEVHFSQDGREVTYMVKLGRLCFGNGTGTT